MNSVRRGVILLWLVGVAALFGPACSPNLAQSPEEENPTVIATTTFIGETVKIIAGDAVEVTILLQPGQNPHSYQLTPQDQIKVSQADVIFTNGFDLEGFLEDLEVGADQTTRFAVVSEGISPLQSSDHAEEHDEDSEEGHHDQDPHVWFDPNNLIIWTENITDVLVEIDPENAQTYQENAAAYQSELTALDSWIRDQVATIPEANRKLVTDHTVFGYFADEYGFDQVGAVVPAPTTEAEASGQQIARLMDTIQKNNVKAIFVSKDIDPAMAARVAEDTETALVSLYFGSLTEGGPVDTYLNFMRYNVKAIIEALG